MTLNHDHGPGDLRAIIFDLDGTLLNSFNAHFRAYEVMLRRFDIHLTADDLRKVYSPDWFAVYRALGLPPEVWDVADKLWLAEAARQPPKLFAGVDRLLDELSTLYPLAIVTSGSGHRVQQDLARTGISGYFRAIVTGDDVPNPKPAPDGILLAAEQLQIAPSSALYVGDTAVDYAAAQAAKMAFIGVQSPLLHEGVPYPFPLLRGATELPNYLIAGAMWNRSADSSLR